MRLGRFGRPVAPGRAVEGRAKGVVESEHTFSAITAAQAAVEP